MLILPWANAVTQEEAIASVRANLSRRVFIGVNRLVSERLAVSTMGHFPPSFYNRQHLTGCDWKCRSKLTRRVETMECGDKSPLLRRDDKASRQHRASGSSCCQTLLSFREPSGHTPSRSARLYLSDMSLRRKSGDLSPHSKN